MRSRRTLDEDGKATRRTVGAVTKLVASLAAGVRSAERGASSADPARCWRRAASYISAA